MLFLLAATAAATPLTITCVDTDPDVECVADEPEVESKLPVATWHTVYDLDGDLTDVTVECPQGEGADIRMNGNGIVQVRSLLIESDVVCHVYDSLVSVAAVTALSKSN